MVTDKHYRSLAKALSWRFTASMDTFIISYVITGKFKWALGISGVEVFTKIFLYYAHERVWQKVKFGRVKRSRQTIGAALKLPA
jgi:uncharacterized membrane protein